VAQVAPVAPVVAPPPAPSPPPAAERVLRMEPKAEVVPRIREAVDLFLLSLTHQNLDWETRRKYITFLKGRDGCLVKWCAKERLSALSDLSVTRMDAFRGTWTDGPSYALKNLERLRAFFEFCVKRGWIAQNSAKAVKSPQIDTVPTLPFTDEEMERILEACGRYPVRDIRGAGSRDRMRAFVLTMRYSGLRISDTISLHPNQRFQHRLRLYTTKTGEAVFVPLPPLVVEALEKIERPGQRYFWSGRGRLATRVGNWSRYLATVFELANVENGHSHRFRDTFSCSLLEQGVPVETVAMLLANTPAIVIKHYAPWIKARQLALEAAVQTTWQSPKAIAEANEGNVAAGSAEQAAVAASAAADAKSGVGADVAIAS
jgi:integrase